LASHLEAIAISRVKKARRDHRRCPRCSRYWQKDDIKECLLFTEDCELEEIDGDDGAVLTEGQEAQRQTICLHCYQRWKAPLRCLVEDQDDPCTGSLQVGDLTPYEPEAGVWVSDLVWVCEKHQAGATVVIGEAYEVIPTFSVKRSQPQRRGRIGPSA